MIEPASIESLKEAVEGLHGGTATFVQAVPVLEEFEGETVWQGVVHVFDLADNPKATRAYAWSSPIEGSDKRRFWVALHFPPVASPIDAVRVSILSQHKEDNGA